MHVALHDGFTGQTVAVAVDGHEVYRRAGLRTDLRISRADAFDAEAAGPEVQVEVTVEPSGPRATIQLDVRSTPYLAVDLIGGTIRFTPSPEPFHYM